MIKNTVRKADKVTPKKRFSNVILWVWVMLCRCIQSLNTYNLVNIFRIVFVEFTYRISWLTYLCNLICLLIRIIFSRGETKENFGFWVKARIKCICIDVLFYFACEQYFGHKYGSKSFIQQLNLKSPLLGTFKWSFYDIINSFSKI